MALHKTNGYVRFFIAPYNRFLTEVSKNLGLPELD